jgi:hypothetical protein
MLFFLNLKFLLKVIQKDDTESSISENDLTVDKGLYDISAKINILYK